MRGAVKLLPTLLAFEDGHLMEEGVAVEMICTIEPFAADLAQEYLVLRVGVSEDVTLEQVLPREPLPTHLAGHGYLPHISLPCCTINTLL